MTKPFSIRSPLQLTIILTLILIVSVFPPNLNKTHAQNTSATDTTTCQDPVLHKLIPTFRIRMHWHPQAQFAGFYMACEEQLALKQGIKLVIEHPTPTEDLFDSLKNDQTDIIVDWPISAIIRAANGDDVINIGQIAQGSALMFIARKSSGIRNAKDISGHRVGMWVAPTLQAPFNAFFKQYSITDVHILPVLTNVDLFLYGGVDVTVGVYYNDYYRLFGSGIDPQELVCFPLNESFPHLVDDGLYCKSTLFHNNPENIEKIRNIVIAGWRLAQKNPKRTLEVVKKECESHNIPYNIAHQRWMLNQMTQLVFPNNSLANNSMDSPGGKTGFKPGGKNATCDITTPNDDKTPHSGSFRRETFDHIISILALDPETVSYPEFAPLEKKTQYAKPLLTGIIPVSDSTEEKKTQLEKLLITDSVDNEQKGDNK